MIRPEGMLEALSDDTELKSVATEVECSMIEIIQKQPGRYLAHPFDVQCCAGRLKRASNTIS